MAEEPAAETRGLTASLPSYPLTSIDGEDYAEPSIAPTPGLTRGADPRSGQPTQFALFSDNWIQLQAYVGSALELPITTGDFESKYGSLGGSQVVKDCIIAMGGVRDSATEFGNPKTLRAALNH